MNQPPQLIPETQLQREQRLFRELFARLGDALLNRVFDLRPEKAIRRRRYLLFLFLVTGFLVSLREYPLQDWAGYLQDIFSFLFIQSGTYIPNNLGNPFNNFFLFGYQALTDPHTLQYLPLFLASFFIALQSAAIYLADIFELEDVSVARKFVNEVALSASDETIRITQGEIFEEHRSSPNYLIGGPGKVIVEIDSAALFEKPDGTPRIIGPTGNQPGGKATLDGFERFRQAIDLRDHYIELRDQNDKSPSVKSRSLDGIPITATDVRFMFSVHRGGQQPDDKNPYPFSQKAIEQLVYKASSRVTPDQANPSTFEFSWINNMIGLIRGKLGGFMNERKLTEYLASIGQPELEKAKQHEEKIAEQKKRLTPPTGETSSIEDMKIFAPEFVPRSQVSNLFAQFVSEFAKSTEQRGVELHWIGVGTWKTQLELVPEEHLTAWRIARENLLRGSDEALDHLRQETELQKMVTLIQSVPLAAYHEVTSQYSDDKDSLKALLLKYHEVFKDLFELMKSNKQRVKPTLLAAIFYVDSIISHKVYPVHRTFEGKAANIYQNLYEKIGSHEVIVRLIEYDREFHPGASIEEVLERILEEWDSEMKDVVVTIYSSRTTDYKNKNR